MARLHARSRIRRPRPYCRWARSQNFVTVSAIEYILFVETPRKIITAIINLRGVSTNKKYYMFYRHAILHRT